jgi:hypothetical protein
MRDVRVYGPRSIREQKSAILNAAEILVKNRFLVPIKPYRHDTYAWEIIRRPVIHPSVAIVAE